MTVNDVMDDLVLRMGRGQSLGGALRQIRWEYGGVTLREELTFERLREASVLRTEEVFHSVKAWNPLEWAGAMAGEAGEAANKAKKLRRGENITPRDIGIEVADTVCYGTLLCSSVDERLGELVIDKFNEVSVARGSTIFL